MNRRSLTYLTLSLVVLLIAVGIIYSRFSSSSLQQASTAPVLAPIVVGSQAPAFTAATTTGLFDLAKEQRPIFLEIFATWCPHCQRETKIIDRLYEKFGTQVAFIAVVGSDRGMDDMSPESSMDILRFQQQFGVNYPIAIYDPSLSVARHYLQGGFPTVVIIGRNKKILTATSGELPYKPLAKALTIAISN